MAAEQGNSYAQKYTEEQAIEKFKEMLEYAETEECLCIQDAFLHIKMASSTFFYLTGKYKVLESIKQDIMANVISRVNKKALHGDYNPTASIWRMKQLGEKDKTEVSQTVTNVTPPTAEELKKAKEDIDNLL